MPNKKWGITFCTLWEFYRKYNGMCPCFKEVLGGFKGDNFTVFTHPDLYIPIRDSDGEFIHWGTIPADEWKGQRFHRVDKVTVKTRKYQHFYYGDLVV